MKTSRQRHGHHSSPNLSNPNFFQHTSCCGLNSCNSDTSHPCDDTPWLGKAACCDTLGQTPINVTFHFTPVVADNSTGKQRADHSWALPNPPLKKSPLDVFSVIAAQVNVCKVNTVLEVRVELRLGVQELYIVCWDQPCFPIKFPFQPTRLAWRSHCNEIRQRCLHVHILVCFGSSKRHFFSSFFFFPTCIEDSNMGTLFHMLLYRDTISYATWTHDLVQIIFQ